MTYTFGDGLLTGTTGSYTITIAGSGSIYAANFGINSSASVLLKNYGSIQGGTGGVVASLQTGSENYGLISGARAIDTTSIIDFKNYGDISGTVAGVNVTTSAPYSRIFNSGDIIAPTAINVSGSSEVYVTNSGTISGTTAAITASSTASMQDAIYNIGAIFGTIRLYGGNDMYDGVSGSLTGAVYLGVGNDTALGGGRAETFYGEAGDDSLDGGGGNDSFFGGDDNDTLDGGIGNDSVDGGAGDDLIFVDSSRDAVVGGSGTDTVVTTLSAYSLVTRIDVEKLIYDGGLNARLLGNGLDNQLTSGEGADLLDGGVGADTMSGGLGDDIYRIDDVGDVVLEAGGLDLIQTTLVAYTLAEGSGVERLQFVGSGSFAGVGNSGANVITGGAGGDRLDGGAGADALSGGLGDDAYVVDDAGDVIRDTGGVDAVESSISFSLATNSQLENLLLTGSSATSGFGNGADNRVTGSDGDNVIDGGAGRDTLTGGGGADVFTLGSGVRVNNIDTITDFTVGVDILRFDSLRFAGLTAGQLSDAAFHIGTQAADSADRFIYDDQTGSLFYDRDGSGSRLLAVEIAKLASGLALEADDIFVV